MTRETISSRIAGIRGFTLIELLVAMGLFMVVITIALGAVLSILNANRKVQSESAIMDNLTLALEDMSREMRFGTNYYCGGVNFSTTQNCSSGGQTVSFTDSDGRHMVYSFSGSSLQRSTDGGVTYIPATAPEVVITNLTFYVLGAGPTPQNTLQPEVVIALKGYAGAKASEQTDFSLQTVVSQRQLDNGL